MRIYKNSIIVTTVLTIVSFFAALIFNFFISVDDFWCNALLGVFGSSFLTLLSSIIGYRVERKKTFEGFSYRTKEILQVLNKYQLSWSLEQKIDYFLDYHDISKIDWDSYYGEFCFLFDPKHKNHTYIYDKIYLPILTINQSINKHVWHFRWYKDGSGKNDVVLSNFVQEIELLIMEVTTEDIWAEGANESIPITDEKNKIVFDTLTELNGEYYRLMYGKRTYNKSISTESR